jgi:GT2 family glycosyltransferase
VTSAVLIATRNRPRIVADTVRSVLAGDTVPDEIVVVDQSPDPNEELSLLARSGPVRVIRAAVPGLSAANNLAVRESGSSILVFVNDDVFVERDWLTNLLRPFEGPHPASVVTGRVIAGPAEVPDAEAPSLSAVDKPPVSRGRIDADPLAGPNWACTREALLEVGPFDERLGAGAPYASAEDNDMGFRLLESGREIVYVHDAVVVHRAWRGGGDLLRVEWTYGYGQGAFFAKHLSRDGWMLRRLLRDLWNRAPVRRGKVRRDAVYSAGLLVGGARWLLTERRGGSGSGI